MPLVTPGDANKIQIEAELIDNISKKLDVIDREIDGLTAKRKAREADAARASIEAARSSGNAWTEFRSMYSTVLDVVRVGQQVWAETGQKFVDYAAQVRDVSRSLGASAEESSRLVQVADDVGISYSALTTSLKMAQKDGIDPSIDGLAKLSDQYLALAPGVERTQFLLDNFGKSGAEMGKLLEQGGAGIREMSAAMDESMILTQEALDQARDFEIAQDAMNDTWDAFTYQVAPPLVNAMTDIINHYRDISTSLEENGYWYTLTHQFSLDDIAAKREASDAALRASESNEVFSGALEENANALSDNSEAVKAAQEALDEYKDMLDEVSQANKDAESFIQSYADFMDDYAERHADAVEKVREAEDELYWVRENNAGKDPLSWQDELGEATNGVNEAKVALQELEASWHESTQKMIYDMVLAKVSVDGLTDAEFKATQDLAVSMGIRSQADADAAKAAMDKATAIADGIALQEDVMNEKAATDEKLLELENAKALAADQSTEAIVNGSLEGASAQDVLSGQIDSATLSLIRQAEEARRTAAAVASIGSGGGSSSGGSGGLSPDERDENRNQHAAGGSFLIPMSYGNEGFKMGNGDSASGGEMVTITPRGANATANKTVNITINNPKGETTEQSERKQLMKLSYLGILA